MSYVSTRRTAQPAVRQPQRLVPLVSSARRYLIKTSSAAVRDILRHPSVRYTATSPLALLSLRRVCPPRRRWLATPAPVATLATLATAHSARGLDAGLFGRRVGVCAVRGGAWARQPTAPACCHFSQLACNNAQVTTRTEVEEDTWDSDGTWTHSTSAASSTVRRPLLEAEAAGSNHPPT